MSIYRSYQGQLVLECTVGMRTFAADRAQGMSGSF